MSLVDTLFATPDLALNVDTLARAYEPAPTELQLPAQYCPHIPDLGSPQERFVLDDRRELLYGGAAGGGKSDAILMSALKYVEIPRYAAIIFRKTYTDLSLEGALMERAHEWLRGTNAKWNESKKKWRFPSGASLTFGYLASTLDRFRYQSAEFQFVGFDELTQFPEADYLYLFSRLRRLAGSTVPIRMRGATNPGGIGHRWVKDRWGIDVDSNGRWRGRDTKDRAFIPAKLRDNRHVDQDEYRESLGELDEHTRQQLEEGDWNARMPGPWVFEHSHIDAAFAIGDEYDAGVRTLPPPVGGAVPLGLDFGESTHVLLGWPLEQYGMHIAHEYTYYKGEPDTQAQEFVRTVLRQKQFNRYPLARQRFDASKPESMRLWVRGMLETGLMHDNVGKPSPIAFNSYKRVTILHMRKMLKRAYDGVPYGYLSFSSQGCPTFKEQIYELQFKNEDTEDIVKKDDHGPDASIALVAPLSRKRKA